jgi:hypothetical protein
MALGGRVGDTGETGASEIGAGETGAGEIGAGPAVDGPDTGATAAQGADATRRTRPGRHRRPRPLVLVALVAALAAGLGALVIGPATGTAAAARVTCDQFGSFGVSADKYVVQNNRWGSDKEQCITENGPTGFVVSSSKATNTAGPAGYPSIYRGCNYGYCTKDAQFPAQVATLGQVRSSWVTSGPTAVPAATTAPAATTPKATTPTTVKPGTTATTTPKAAATTVPAAAPAPVSQYNTAYDIWFNRTNSSVGRNNGAEMMIWLNRTSWVQPIGKKYYEAIIDNNRWEIWYGQLDGLPVISYVSKTAKTSVSNLAIEKFVADSVARGVVNRSWYLTSVQAGFEPWTGGTGLTTKSFSVTRNGR